MQALLGRKIGMTSIIAEDGRVRAVTLIMATPNVITQLRTTELDGYDAIQFGFETAKKPHKAQAGHAKKHAQLEAAPKVVRELRTTPEETETPGTTFDVTTFTVGDKVDVVGTSKGKGFAGTIKRHNFMRSRKTHGGKGDVRKPGSIGSMYPQKVFKGKRMAGQMGYDRVTVKNLEVALVDQDRNVIGLNGAVPGPRKGIVMIKGVA